MQVPILATWLGREADGLAAVGSRRQGSRLTGDASPSPRRYSSSNKIFSKSDAAFSSNCRSLPSSLILWSNANLFCAN